MAPNEVISEIIQAAPASDSALQDFQAVPWAPRPVLYRVVALEDCESIDDFCYTVLENPPKFAGLVRSLTVNVSASLCKAQVFNPLILGVTDR
jgi:ABC-type amino acid transport substrate-binding protein